VTTFELFTQDPDESFDERPASLRSLADWLAARNGGSAPFEPDPHEGVGLRFSSGVEEWLVPSFGGE